MGKGINTRTKYVSKGLRNSVSRKLVKSLKREYLSTPMARTLNQMKAQRQGRDIVVTIRNPDASQTNKPWIKKRISGQAFLKEEKASYSKFESKDSVKAEVAMEQAKAGRSWDDTNGKWVSNGKFYSLS